MMMIYIIKYSLTSLPSCKLHSNRFSTFLHLGKPGATPDTVNNFGYLSEVYALSDPEYDGRWTVPVLFDKVQKKIVCNDSAEIIRMLTPEFNEFCETVQQSLN